MSFPPEVQRRRNMEFQNRKRVADRRLSEWLKRNHPDIYDRARRKIERDIAKERGVLPGEENG